MNLNIQQRKERKNMKKVMTVDEVLAEIQAKKKIDKKGVEKFVYNRFNKKTYTNLLRAMMNDPNLKMVTVKLKKGDIDTTDDIMVSQLFREFLKGVLIKAGVDASDASAVMSEDFTIDNADGLYEFFATSLYLYMNSGNKFDLIPTPELKASIYLDTIPESSKTAEVRDPKTKESMGTFETTKKAHKVVKVKSSCPSWLSSRRKVD